MLSSGNPQSTKDTTVYISGGTPPLAQRVTASATDAIATDLLASARRFPKVSPFLSPFLLWC